MNWQREYFKLAATWLACRLETMSGRRWMRSDERATLKFSLLGEHDYWREMKLLCAEVKENNAR